MGRFCVETGEPVHPTAPNFSAVFGQALCELAEKDPQNLRRHGGHAGGTGLNGFAQRFPERFFDVGIAEGHAAAMAAGMAKQGMTPVFAVYSTFLQRSYDMLLHDVALQASMWCWRWIGPAWWGRTGRPTTASLTRPSWTPSPA